MTLSKLKVLHLNTAFKPSRCDQSSAWYKSQDAKLENGAHGRDTHGSLYPTPGLHLDLTLCVSGTLFLRWSMTGNERSMASL